MSRIGKAAVYFDEKTQVSVGGGSDVIVKGQKGTLAINMKAGISAKVDGKKVIFTRSSDDKRTRALHGLYRALVQNAVIGLSKGFTRQLELHGVGYRASVVGRKLELSLGFSHPVVLELPEGIDVKVEKQTSISVSGINRELVGRVAAKIRGFRPPEPYLGKGVRYTDEIIRKKAGKSASK